MMLAMLMFAIIIDTIGQLIAIRISGRYAYTLRDKIVKRLIVSLVLL